MSDFNEYLAIHVLNESQTVSYRMLSRALKIHSSRAKQCLYDFYKRQNQKKPNAVSATYLVSGVRRQTTSLTNGHSQISDDVPMQSSPPFPSSSAPHPSQDDGPTATINTRHVLLTKETDLEAAKSSLDEITSIHIYAISASPISDLQTLTECNRRVRTDYLSEDPLEAWKQYGIIQNEQVWRRTRKGQPMPIPAAVPASTAKPTASAKPAATATTKAALASKAEEAAPSTKRENSDAAKAKTQRPPPTLKKESSSIMSSFAKSKAPTKPTKPAAKEEEEEDYGPALSDEDADPEDASDAMLLDTAPKESEKDALGKSKADREAELKQMMEQDDEDEDMRDGDGDVPTPTASAPPEEDVEMGDAGSQDTGALDEAEKGGEEKGEVRVENGRRRGRRRIMKKRTVKDEEGYLVTKEEAAWESFSEEDVPPAKKAKPSVMAPFAKSAGAGSGTAGKKKGGGGNIMSFFAKK